MLGELKETACTYIDTTATIRLSNGLVSWLVLSGRQSLYHTVGRCVVWRARQTRTAKRKVLLTTQVVLPPAKVWVSQSGDRILQRGEEQALRKSLQMASFRHYWIRVFRFAVSIFAHSDIIATSYSSPCSTCHCRISNNVSSTRTILLVCTLQARPAASHVPCRCRGGGSSSDQQPVRLLQGVCLYGISKVRLPAEI